VGLTPPGRVSTSLEGLTPPRASFRLAQGTGPLERVFRLARSRSRPTPRTCSPDRSINCSDASRVPRSKVNPHHAGPLTPPGNHIPVLYSHPRHCAGAVREGRCHSMTLSCPAYSCTSSTSYPSKEDGNTLERGTTTNVNLAWRVFSVTSGPVRPSLPLCRHPRHCRVIPNAVGTRVDRTSPRPPLCSFRCFVSQA
jgi:hypothetical protein